LLEAIIEPGGRVTIKGDNQKHHEAFVRDRTIVRSADVDALLQDVQTTLPRLRGEVKEPLQARQESIHPHNQRRHTMMNRRTFSTALLAGAAASLISTRGRATNTTPPKARNVVLVHGLFADGSCWTEVIARLQAAGLNATAVQNPLTTLPEAVASAERVLARQDGPTVLVGHSFSGMIVTEAGVHPNVSALVYVAARAPDAGEDYAALAKTYPTPPASAGIVFDGDEGRLGEAAFLRDFAGDLPEAKAKVLYAVQQPFHKALLTGKTTRAAWRSKPSYYAVSTEDRTINPDLERFMARRMGARTIEVKASHLSLISQPDEITRLILEAAGQQA
jgi:pimeloyl-ACP methyl ester carboxylesterase